MNTDAALYSNPFIRRHSRDHEIKCFLFPLFVVIISANANGSSIAMALKVIDFQRALMTTELLAMNFLWLCVNKENENSILEGHE